MIKTTKILIVLLCFVFASFSSVEAAGFSGSRSSSSSFKSSSTPKTSIPKTSIPKSSSTPKSNGSTTPKATTPKSSSNTKSNNSTTTYKQETNWANTLITAAGIYLILDSYDDEGQPVYINQDTGEEITAEELENISYEEVEEGNALQYEPSTINEQFLNTLNPLLGIVLAAFVGCLGLILLSGFKRIL
jgi:hypothetical protein